MRRKYIFAILIFATSGFSQSSVKDFTIPAATAPPFTYCIGYLANMTDSSFLRQLETSPPDLYHLGYHIPFKGALGPTYGHELFTNDILPPDQVQREIERIKGIIHKMRAAGVNRLIPYVYTMAFFGRPDERSGFFNFYDHWDDYRQFGLGPKPKADPSLWSQVRGPHQLGGGPPGILHYDPCINHPAWSEYLDVVVRELAKVGYDGMFFDVNTLYCYCPHCQEKFDIYLLEKYGRQGLREIFGTADHRVLNLSTIYRDFEKTILQAFKPYLAANWQQKKIGDILAVEDTSEIRLENDWRLLRCSMQGSLGEFPPAVGFKTYLQKRFAGQTTSEVATENKHEFRQTVLRYFFNEFLHSDELADLLTNRFGSADIRRRCCTDPRDMLLWVETQRFWCQSMADMFARLKKVGRITFAQQGRGDDFYTVANLGSMSSLDALNKRRVDAIDLVHWAPEADMQMFEEMNQPGVLESGVIFSNVFAFKWAMAAGTRAGTLLYKTTDDRAADLSNAEAAAGGGGAFIQPGLAAPESRKRWNRFFDEHSDLWVKGSSWAEVGLLFWSDQIFYEYPEHLAMTRRLVHILSENQVPFDIITEENLGGLSQYQVIIAPQLRYLSNEQIQRLLQYARAGGNLVIIDPFGSEDKFARSRESDPLAKIGAERSDFRAVNCGHGQLLRLQENHLPPRQSDLWVLMEERVNNFLQARDFLNQDRQNDLANGVDLGSGFISQIEKSLSRPLRWCPQQTDPSVYLSAFFIPAQKGHRAKLVVHAVNYHLPILVAKEPEKGEDATWSTRTKSGEPVVAKNVRIAVPLPKDAKVSRVFAVSPTEKVTPIKWTINEERINMVVNELRIYKAIIAELQSSDGS